MKSTKKQQAQDICEALQALPVEEQKAQIMELAKQSQESRQLILHALTRAVGNMKVNGERF